jgi:hypothetical protein
VVLWLERPNLQGLSLLPVKFGERLDLEIGIFAVHWLLLLLGGDGCWAF